MSDLTESWGDLGFVLGDASEEVASLRGPHEAVLSQIFQEPALLGDNLYISLHTQDPGLEDQTANEVAYSNYSRVAVSRTSGHWEVVGNRARNQVAITFPQVTEGFEIVTHFAVGLSPVGRGSVLYAGPLSEQAPLQSGVIFSFSAGALDIEVDV